MRQKLHGHKEMTKMGLSILGGWFLYQAASEICGANDPNSTLPSWAFPAVWLFGTSVTLPASASVMLGGLSSLAASTIYSFVTRDAYEVNSLMNIPVGAIFMLTCYHYLAAKYYQRKQLLSEMVP